MENATVIEGRMGALLGDEVLEASAGDLVYKPRGKWHVVEPSGPLRAQQPARG